MKKSSFLALATAAAIVTTSAATFAAWDTVESTASNKVTVRDQVTITAETLTLTQNEASKALETAPVYTGEVTFTVEDKDQLADQLTLNAVVKDGGAPVESGYTLVIKDTTAGDAVIENGGVDSTIAASNPYDLELTITDEKLAGKELTVEVTGTLSKATS